MRDIVESRRLGDRGNRHFRPHEQLLSTLEPQFEQVRIRRFRWYVANDSGGKAYIQSFGEALHVELKPLGLNVSVLVVGPTQTAIIEKFGLTPDMMPMKPMSAEQCTAEGLQALAANRATHISGRVNRIMSALIPSRLSRTMMGTMMGKTLANAPKSASAASEAK